MNSSSLSPTSVLRSFSPDMFEKEVDSSSNEKMISLNYKVSVNYKNKGKYYPGIITKDYGNNTFDILYDDGDTEQNVPIEFIKKQPELIEFIKNPENQKEIRKYIEEFGNEISINNPQNTHEEITLSLLMKNIFDKLLEDNIYIFNESKDFENPDQLQLLQTNNAYIKHTSIIIDNDTPFKPSLMSIYKFENIIIKQFNLNIDVNFVYFTKNDYIQGFIIILCEICLQYYAFYLNNLKPLHSNEHINLTVIPKLYKIELTNKKINSFSNDAQNLYINIYMEFLERLPDNVKEFLFWDPIIKNTFHFFESQHLFHNDTAHRNVYWTKIDDIDKLAIIDFGESNLLLQINNPQPSGYFKKTNEDIFLNYWLKNKIANRFNNDFFVNFPEEEIDTYKKYIFGGVIKKSKSKKSKSKKSKSKKSKSKIYLN